MALPHIFIPLAPESQIPILLVTSNIYAIFIFPSATVSNFNHFMNQNVKIPRSNFCEDCLRTFKKRLAGKEA